MFHSRFNTKFKHSYEANEIEDIYQKAPFLYLTISPTNKVILVIKVCLLMNNLIKLVMN